MITYEIANADDVAATFDSMLQQLHHFKLEDIPTGLTTWQVQDMNRKYPKTDLEPDGASTLIHPRSVLPRVYHQKAKGTRRKVVMKQSGRLNNIGRPRSTRPILRVFLYAKLVDRIEKLADDKLGWEPGGS